MVCQRPPIIDQKTSSSKCIQSQNPFRICHLVLYFIMHHAGWDHQALVPKLLPLKPEASALDPEA